jgi:hypothetical protein
MVGLDPSFPAQRFVTAVPGECDFAGRVGFSDFAFKAQNLEKEKICLPQRSGTITIEDAIGEGDDQNLGLGTMFEEAKTEATDPDSPHLDCYGSELLNMQDGADDFALVKEFSFVPKPTFGANFISVPNRGNVANGEGLFADMEGLGNNFSGMNVKK